MWRPSTTRLSSFSLPQFLRGPTVGVSRQADLLSGSMDLTRRPARHPMDTQELRTMTTKRFAAATLFALLTQASAAAIAQGTARVVAGPESKLWIEGTSNLHGWSCKAEKLEAALDLDAAAAPGIVSVGPKGHKRG